MIDTVNTQSGGKVGEVRLEEKLARVSNRRHVSTAMME